MPSPNVAIVMYVGCLSSVLNISVNVPKISSALTTRQIGISKEVKELSWRMQHRLNKRYIKLKMRQKEDNKCIVAIARELSAFIWELVNKCNLTIPEQESTVHLES